MFSYYTTQKLKSLGDDDSYLNPPNSTLGETINPKMFLPTRIFKSTVEDGAKSPVVPTYAAPSSQWHGGVGSPSIFRS